MISKKFFEELEEVVIEKGIIKEHVIHSFGEALIAGCKKNHDVRSCRFEIREERNEILLFTQQLVVSEYSLDHDNEYSQILLKDALEIKRNAKANELMEVEVSPKDFGVFAITAFKNKLNEMLIGYQKQLVYDHFKKFENEIIPARITGVTDDFYRLDLGSEMTTILPKKEALPNDNFYEGQTIKVFVTAVEMKPKWPKIFVSRTSKELITRLLEDIVPELKDGTIQVMGIARDPGDRAKIGIISSNPQVDAIGACVGKDGVRIKEIVAALSGEKIDLFKWSNNERELIANSLQPAEVVSVVEVDHKTKKAIAIVLDDQLSLAIGKLGQNAKLAALATKWSIDIKSESDAKRLGIEY